MAKTKREYIIATFIISCAATVFSIVSMATEEWINAELKANFEGLGKSVVNYGIFSGTLVQFYLQTGKDYKIAVACIFKENICGFSTASEGDKRSDELQSILDGTSCKTNEQLSRKSEFSVKPDISYEIFENDRLRDPKQQENENSEVELINYVELEYLDNVDKSRYVNVKRNVIEDNFDIVDNKTIVQCDPKFLNAGLWLTSTFFLSLAIIMGALTATISVLNIAGNPISPWLNIWGLYIWNSLSACFYLLTMILWGIEYSVFISYNVGIITTLDGTYKNDTVHLGYSYWMIFVPLFLHLTNIGLFYFRQHLIEREPEITEEKIETADRDGMIFVY